jgi:hypothetical protein
MVQLLVCLSWLKLSKTPDFGDFLSLKYYRVVFLDQPPILHFLSYFELPHQISL